MRKEKNTSSSGEKSMPVLKVVQTAHDSSRLEFEIDRHVRCIRALIQKMRPVERQRYYDGLLSHLLCQPVEYPFTKVDKKQHNTDYSNLTTHELALIRELSVKMEELYRHSDGEMN